jgi:hypothetical protein
MKHSLSFTICAEVSPFSTVKACHLGHFIRFFIRVILKLWNDIFLWFHLLLPLPLLCSPLPITLKILLPWPILKILLLHLIRIWTSKGRTLMRHVHGWRRGLRIEAIQWVKLGWRESRVRGVVRVPPILISPKILSAPTASTSTLVFPTCHVIL